MRSKSSFLIYLRERCNVSDINYFRIGFIGQKSCLFHGQNWSFFERVLTRVSQVNMLVDMFFTNRTDPAGRWKKSCWTSTCFSKWTVRVTLCDVALWPLMVRTWNRRNFWRSRPKSRFLRFWPVCFQIATLLTTSQFIRLKMANHRALSVTGKYFRSTSLNFWSPNDHSRFCA